MAINNTMIERVYRLIDEDRIYLEAGVCSGDMINILGVTRKEFNELMLVSYGCPFVECINKKRVEFAKDLMRRGGVTKSDVAKRSGFLTVDSFNFVFNRVMGQMPEVWYSHEAAISA